MLSAVEAKLYSRWQLIPAYVLSVRRSHSWYCCALTSVPAALLYSTHARKCLLVSRGHVQADSTMPTSWFSLSTLTAFWARNIILRDRQRQHRGLYWISYST